METLPKMSLALLCFLSAVCGLEQGNIMLLSHLPAPKQHFPAPAAPEPSPSAASVGPEVKSKQVPPYGSRDRLQYRPRRLDDFGGGGAFPEIHVAQFPLDMGKKEQKSSAILAVTVDKEGSINYDAVLRQGRNKDKLIASDHNAIVPKVGEAAQGSERPDEEEVERVRRETGAALGLLVSQKLSAAQPKNIAAQPGAPTYIKYTPSHGGAAHASGATQRIIKLQDMPVDPMEPPKFRHKKVPRGPGSPPVPVLHSPPRAVSVRDQQDWKIPPCISNWKNPKGYTIPLDKRLAADGRGLATMAINDQFAKVAEALYVAEGQAREAVEMRKKVQMELRAKEKAGKEETLRMAAASARNERSGMHGGLAARVAPVPAVGGAGLPGPPPGRALDEALARAPRGGRAAAEESDSDGDASPMPAAYPSGGGRGDAETAEERRDRKARDSLRKDRAKDRERDRRLDANAPGGKRSKTARDADRDVGERIALGQANVRGGGGEAMYDQRLFNQDAGMASGFGAEDAYNTFDKPLFAERGSALYKPKAAADDELYGGEGAAADDRAGKRAKVGKGFAGADYGAAAGGGEAVQFEKAQEEDPFGLDVFMGNIKQGKKKGALDGIGGGSMRGGGAAGGGGSRDDYAGGSSRKVDFERSSRR